MSSDLPELLALGIGAIGCAALARRSRRNRLMRRVTIQPSGPPFEHSELAVDTDTLIFRFAGVPPWRLRWPTVGWAMPYPSKSDWLKRLAFGPSRSAPPVPTFGLMFPADPRRAGSGLPRMAKRGTSGTKRSNGPRQIVHISHSLPVGEDEMGTWLVPLQPGNCLPLVGEAAQDLWRAARRVQEGWSWAERVLVTDDPAVVQNEVELLSNDGTSP